MHRLTARLLLVLLLVGVFAPAALAIAAPAPHACCMRKPMNRQTPHDAQFNTPGCCSHNCCGQLTVSQWAQTRPSRAARVTRQSASLLSELRPLVRTIDSQDVHSGRAPPPSSIA
jgi:hypothetical protein